MFNQTNFTDDTVVGEITKYFFSRANKKKNILYILYVLYTLSEQTLVVLIKKYFFKEIIFYCTYLSFLQKTLRKNNWITDI